VSLLRPHISRRNRMAVDVLIVDNSAAIRKILHRVLLQAEVELGKVHEAGDGIEALERLKTEKVGLILSDINMPNMDGIELLGKIRADETHKGVPVLMVTTEGSQARVMQALELGANGYVRKPFTADQIKEKLTGLI
jgi:two-component system, chemotaxis family, chemotaxis protein CheY